MWSTIIQALIGMFGQMASAGITSNIAYNKSAAGQAEKWANSLYYRKDPVYDDNGNIVRYEYTATGNKPAYDGYTNYMRGATGAGLTQAQIEQNAWASQEAQAARDDMRDIMQHELQYKVDDARAAGVNAIFALGNGQGATGVSSPSAGGSASAGAPAGPDAGLQSFGQIMQSLTSMLLASSQIQVNESEARKNNASAENMEITNLSQNELNRAQLRLITNEGSVAEARVSEVLQAVRTGAADEALKRAGVTKSAAETGLIMLQAVEQNITNENRQELIDLEKRLMRAQELGEYAEVNKLKAEAGKLYAETLTESERQRLTAAQAGIAETDDKYRKAYDLIQMGVMVTEGLHNTTSAVGDVVDMVNPFSMLSQMFGKNSRSTSFRGRRSDIDKFFR